MALLAKMMSLPGADMIEMSEGFPHINDYRFWGNREYVKSVYGPKLLKFWVSWNRTHERYAPSGFWDSVSWLNSVGNANGSYFARLDRIIAAANSDNIGVFLQVDENNPTWASPSGDPHQYPSSITSNSPWGWFISYLMMRYRQGVARNPSGPNPSNFYGNPEGAWLYGFEFCNEPNYFGGSSAACSVAQMFQAIEVIAANHWPYGNSLSGMILGPGTADNDGGGSVIGFRDFTEQVLTYLPSGWQPRTYIGWSHHNYNDIDDGLVSGPAPPGRVLGVYNRLHGDYNPPWRPGDRNVWVTEGAARETTRQASDEMTTPTQEQEQVKKMTINYQSLYSIQRNTGFFPTIAQHGLHNTPYNPVKYGLYKNFHYKDPNNPQDWAHPGTPLPSANTWRTLYLDQ